MFILAANVSMQSASNGIIPTKTTVGLLTKVIFSSLCRKCRFFISEIYSCFFMKLFDISSCKDSEINDGIVGLA